MQSWIAWGWSKKNRLTKKAEIYNSTNFQCFFATILGIGCWASRINWCEIHWYPIPVIFTKKYWESVELKISVFFSLKSFFSLHPHANQLGFHIRHVFFAPSESWKRGPHKNIYTVSAFSNDVQFLAIMCYLSVTDIKKSFCKVRFSL